MRSSILAAQLAQFKSFRSNISSMISPLSICYILPIRIQFQIVLNKHMNAYSYIYINTTYQLCQ